MRRVEAVALLNLGPMGVVVPHVDTAEEARATMQARRFPQLKGVPDYEPQAALAWTCLYCDKLEIEQSLKPLELIDALIYKFLV